MANKTIGELTQETGALAATDELVILGDGDAEAKRIEIGGYFRPKLLVSAARITSNQTLTNAAYTEIIYNSAPTNIGSQYNTSTGRFTAAADGLYSLAASIITSFADSIDDVAVLVRVKNAAGTTLETFQGIYLSTAQAGGVIVPVLAPVFSMSATDYVSVSVYHSSGADRTLIISQPASLYLKIYKIW
jgi:hypothetical protein